MTTTDTTIQGDTWDMIAYKQYGAETGAAALLEANSELSSIVVFPAGLTVVVPEYTKPTTDRLPPWRR